MAEGKVIPFSKGEYPDLDGLEMGAAVTLRGQAVIEDMGDGSMGLRIESMEFETEGLADREMKRMRGDDKAAAGAGYDAKAGDDF